MMTLFEPLTTFNTWSDIKRSDNLLATFRTETNDKTLQHKSANHVATTIARFRDDMYSLVQRKTVKEWYKSTRIMLTSSVFKAF